MRDAAVSELEYEVRIQSPKSEKGSAPRLLEASASGKSGDSEVLKVVRGGADATDGIEVTSLAVGPAFPNGMMVAMNSNPRNFLYFRWEDIADAGPVKLKNGRK